jgi:hypothetical protein
MVMVKETMEDIERRMGQIKEMPHESTARRAAARAGYKIMKSRRQDESNQGHFTIIDPRTNAAVAGTKFEMTARDVIQWLRAREELSR